MQTMIREAPTAAFVAMVLVPLAMAGAAILAAWRARRQAALISGTAVAPIGMAKDGYRKFQGTAEAPGGRPLVAPLTGSPCVWFDARVEQWTRRRSPKNSPDYHVWVTVRSLTSSAPLLVRDATGACAVDVVGAEVTPTDKSQWTGATLEPSDRNPQRLGPSQSTDGFVETSGGADGRYRYSEARIYAGDPLLVVGAFASHRFAPGTSADEEDDIGGDDAVDDNLENDAESDVDDDAGETTSALEVANPWRDADTEAHDSLWARAADVTWATIGTGGSDQPLILSTASEAAHVAMTEVGSRAAFLIALIPLAIAALVTLVRFS